MCGIAGFLTSTEIFSKQDLEHMTNTMTHRGPNAAEYFFNKTIGLGHRRLSILDLSDNANQPFFSQDKNYIIVYNGEVYNFKELMIKYGLSPKNDF